MTKRKNKNVSHRISNGRTMQTRDEYLEGGYPKQGYENKGLYRTIIVIGSNKNNETMVISGTTKGRHQIECFGNNKTTYNAYVHTKDNEGNPIKPNRKFKLNKKKKSVSKKEVNKINKNCFSSKKTSNELKKRNKEKARKLKNRN